MPGEAKVLIEDWRREEYSTAHPHSHLGYRPPAPEAFVAAAGEGLGWLEKRTEHRGRVKGEMRSGLPPDRERTAK